MGFNCCLELAHCGGRSGICRGGGRLAGVAAQVQELLEGKYGIEFSGKQPSRVLHLLMKVGQAREVLGCQESGPHEMHAGTLSQVSALRNSLTQLVHLMGMQISLHTSTRWSLTQM